MHSSLRQTIYLTCAFLLIALCATPAICDVYYVAPSGSDSNPGTAALPWLTIQKAANTLVAGDTVYVKAGTYQERVIPKNSGAVGESITYAAYGNDNVTLDGSSVSVPRWAGLFEIMDKSYIQVVGFKIKNSSYTGILVEDSSHIRIEQNYTYDTFSSGIGVWNCDHVTISNNEVELACNDGDQECITVAGTDYFEISNNHVHHGGPGISGAEGIAAKDGSRNGKVLDNHVHHMNRLGIYVDAWDKHTYNIEVFRNVVHDCQADGFSVASETGGLLENITIFNNIAFRNKYVGITIAGWGEPTAGHPMKDIKVINNTFHNNGFDPWGGGIALDNPEAQNVIIRNNICSQNLYFQIAVAESVPVSSYSVDHNLIDGFRGTEGEIYGAQPVTGDPAFVNAAQADYHLQAGSPAIDKGSLLNAPLDDLDGKLRTPDGAVDIGAYEYLTVLRKSVPWLLLLDN